MQGNADTTKLYSVAQILTKAHRMLTRDCHDMLAGRIAVLLATMKLHLILSTLLVATCSAQAAETIVLLRHGEKPEAGLGQITCQGLNRALALPGVLLGRYGVPAAIFAANPGQQKEDRGIVFSYVRPLATIEPTAIRAGLPVDTRFGFDQIGPLQAALLAPGLQNATVFVAWEHHLAENLARNLVSSFGGNPADVPKWRSEDFDSLYVVTLEEDTQGRRRARFQRDSQGLDGQARTCPSP